MFVLIFFFHSKTNLNWLGKERGDTTLLKKYKCAVSPSLFGLQNHSPYILIDVFVFVLSPARV